MLRFPLVYGRQLLFNEDGITTKNIVAPGLPFKFMVGNCFAIKMKVTAENILMPGLPLVYDRQLFHNSHGRLSQGSDKALAGG